MNLPNLSIILPTNENDISDLINVKIKIKPYFCRIQSLCCRLSIILHQLEFGGYWKKDEFTSIKSEIFDCLNDYEKDRTHFLPFQSRVHLIHCCEYLYTKLTDDFRFCIDYEICENDMEKIESEIIESIRNNENIFQEKV